MCSLLPTLIAGSVIPVTSAVFSHSTSPNQLLAESISETIRIFISGALCA
jgi:hypothetical protein